MSLHLKSIVFLLVLVGGFLLAKPARVMPSVPDAPATEFIPSPPKEVNNTLLPDVPESNRQAFIERDSHYTPQDIEALIRESARKYGLPETKVVRIAWCESKFIPKVRSKNGRYVGIYQFDLQTWNNTPEGKAGISREDPVANINAAHRHMKAHGYAAWGCK